MNKRGVKTTFPVLSLSLSLLIFAQGQCADLLILEQFKLSYSHSICIKPYKSACDHLYH